MVGQLTYGKRQWESLDGEMRQLIPIFHQACQEMSGYIDEDTNAFNDYMVNTQDFIKNRNFLRFHYCTF